MTFMQTHKIYLTPISPIHIGCGEDFEPTNYVIDDGVLYHFEPSNLNLDPTKRQELLNHSNRMDLLAIQRFFLANKNTAMAQAHYFADVASGITQIYAQRLGKVAQRENNGKTVIAKLEIERTAYQPYSSLPYVPASSVKGALMTAFLDQKHKKNGNPKIPTHLAKSLTKEYIGEFSDSLGRVIRFGDFISQYAVQTKVCFAVNHKKIISKNGRGTTGIKLHRETITAGQYRAFASELVLQEKNVKGINVSKNELIATLKHFYLPVFSKEMMLLIQRNLVDKNWVKNIMTLLESNQVTLIRLGKNGADSKVYQGENVAQIKIMKGKGNKPDYKDRATTVWLAAENDKSTAGLLPFGWAILEFDSGSENQALKQWCETQPKSLFDRSSILAKREAQKAEQTRLKAEEEAKQQAKIAEEKAKVEMLNSLSDNQRLVEEKLTQWATQEKKQFISSSVFSEAKKLLEEAQQWNKDDRQYLYEKIDPTQPNQGLQKYVDGLSGFSNLKAKSAVEFKKLRNKLVAE